jgi:hyperosmotically inducible periplasmic protein
MKNTRLHLAAMGCVLGSALFVSGQTPTPQPAPDNTKTNKTGSATTTADQQKQNPSDVEITRQIRQLVTKDKGLSTYAKNVKIVTENGIVTLTGPVRSDDEKKSVEKKAADIAGVGHVKSEIQIAASQTEKKPK